MRSIQCRRLGRTLCHCLALLLLSACAPAQVPRLGAISELPAHPNAQVIEATPEEIVPFITTAKRWLGRACPGVWASYAIPGSAPEVDAWYQRTLRMSGWAEIADVVPTPQQPDDAEETWSVWFRGGGERDTVATLFLNPTGLTIAPNMAQSGGEGEGAPEAYTYLLVLICPIYTRAVPPYAR